MTDADGTYLDLHNCSQCQHYWDKIEEAPDWLSEEIANHCRTVHPDLQRGRGGE